MGKWKPNARQVRMAAQIAREVPISLDRLPYTKEFEAVYSRMRLLLGEISESQVWLCLLSARKRGMVGARIRGGSR